MERQSRLWCNQLHITLQTIMTTIINQHHRHTPRLSRTHNQKPTLHSPLSILTATSQSSIMSQATTTSHSTRSRATTMNQNTRFMLPNQSMDTTNTDRQNRTSSDQLMELSAISPRPLTHHTQASANTTHESSMTDTKPSHTLNQLPTSTLNQLPTSMLNQLLTSTLNQPFTATLLQSLPRPLPSQLSRPS